MGIPIKTWHIFFFCLALFFTATSSEAAETHSPITRYLIRLDQHFSSHRLAKTVLIMVPAENDYRAIGFSRILVDGIINADPTVSKTNIAAMARRSVFSQVLESRGLKSIQTRNLDTVLTYEGIIISPADIAISPYNPSKDGYLYTASVRFSPLAFPDQWESRRRRYRTKKIIDDFYLLFQ